MPLTPSQLAALKTELQANPEALAAAVPGAGTETLPQMVAAGRYQDAATLLNLQGSVAGATVPTGVQPIAEFQGAVVAAEFMALPQAQRDDLISVVNAYGQMYGGVPLNDPGTWGSVIPSYFPSTATVYAGHSANTYQQLSALKSRPCSRAETLFGAGTVLAWQDIAAALAS